MPVRESHRAGTPSWIDLATTDVEGALDFYAAVLGWDYERDPTGEINYVMAVMDGHPAAGVFDMPPEMLSEGVPPCWNVYITVDDADEFADQVAAAGGAVMRPAIDVPEPGPSAAGRMVIAADPTGAVFCTWTPIAAIGAGIVNAPGALTWAEVATHDEDAAAAFYCELFGWQAGTMDEAPDGPVLFTLDGAPVASTSMAPLPPGVPPHWRVSLGVADVDAACAATTSNGGNVIVPPFDFGPGRAATVADPAGAIFDLVTLTDWPE
ncbi:VOC family protein [Candidatus Poriferisodalis sp.]|uniref:VOC family protein n=1 Tax=Candidatus Poriferisodalis sp. TaxID=3101277 RepID=UPI003B0217D4